MQQKAFTLLNKGMNRDLSVSKAGESAAFDNHNIRIEARDSDTMLSVTSERGNKAIVFADGAEVILGRVIGWNVLNNHILLFSHDEDSKIDRIYRVDYNGDVFNNNLLFSGNLKFDEEHPIESIVSFETDAVQKIYWVDGKNVLRFMNFMDDSKPWGDDDTFFDTNRTAQFTASAIISKNNSGNSRPNGVAQYLLTYFNKHGQETNYTWMSDLVYLSPLGRGGAADETNNNKINLTFSNLDTSFSHFRVYSVFRSSLDGQTVSYLVYEGRTSSDNVLVTDDGAHLTLQDSTRLLYLGSQAVIASTITHKDETLFLGDLQSVGKSSYPRLEQTIRQNMIDWSVGYDKGWESKAIEFVLSDGDGELGDIAYVNNDGTYPYSNQLQYTSSQISTFKGGEKYRFGLKFQLADGTDTEAFWIGDKINPVYPVVDNESKTIHRVIAKCTIPDVVMEQVRAVPEIKTVQLVIAEATYADRAIKAQGIINPTMFNTWERYQERLYSIPSWIARPRQSNVAARHFEAVHNATKTSGEIACNYWEEGSQSSFPYFRFLDYESSNPTYAGGTLDGTGDYDCRMIVYAVYIANLWPNYNVTVTAYVIEGKALNNTGSGELPTCHIDKSPWDTDGEVYWVLDEEYSHSTLRGDYDNARYLHTDTNYKLTLTCYNGYAGYSGWSIDDEGSGRSKAIHNAYVQLCNKLLENAGIGNGQVVPETVYNNWYYGIQPDTARYSLGHEPMVSTYVSTFVDAANASEAGSSDPSSKRWIVVNDTTGVVIGNAPASSSKKHVMYVDENVVTLNSPELAYEAVSIDNAKYKFRIVGVAKVTSNITDYTIDAEQGYTSGENVYRTNFSRNISQGNNINGLITWPLWIDGGIKAKGTSHITTPSIKSKDFERDGNTVGYWMYLWGRIGNITGYYDKKDETSQTPDLLYDDHEFSILNKKRVANLHFSYETIYSLDDSVDYEPATLREFNYLSSQFLQLNVDEDTEYYDANIDTVLSVPGNHKYPVLYSTTQPDTSIELEQLPYVIDNNVKHYDKNIFSVDSVHIQFRSPAHAVIALDSKTEDGLYKQSVLPYIFDDEKLEELTNGTTTIDGYPHSISGALLPWKDYINHEASPSSYPYIDYQPQQIKYNFASGKHTKAGNLTSTEPYLLIGEIYEDFGENDTRYGGTTNAAIEKCRFIPAGPAKTIEELDTEAVVFGNQGDTYFQRWDCVKSMPYSDDAVYGVTDIVSFLVETHINVEGRTDLQRGINNLCDINFATFNGINPVYSQSNNFKVTRDLDEDFSTDSFRSSITWTLPKADLADVDEWTHVTLASTLKLDGDKGICRALHRFNNSIIAFQDRGISEILFNSRTQVATADGVPVEIANSGKVDGKRYISNKYGNTNKWSIVEGKSGLFFVDSINKAFCAVTTNQYSRLAIDNISSKLGFSAWFRNNNKTESWNPRDFNNIVSFYDKVHSDIYLMTKEEGDESCLVFNESLGSFTSFYDYRAVSMMTNIEDRFVSYRYNPEGNPLWLQNEGMYCNFFGTQYPFWVTYRVPPEPLNDKIWTNLDVQVDFSRILDEDGESELGPEFDLTHLNEKDYREEESFDEIEVWNEYQTTGKFIERPIKKFRTWRYAIPRAAENDRNIFGLDRIRNPWVNIRLKKYPHDDEVRDIMQLHDVVVKYFE